MLIHRKIYNQKLTSYSLKSQKTSITRSFHQWPRKSMREASSASTPSKRRNKNKSINCHQTRISRCKSTTIFLQPQLSKVLRRRWVSRALPAQLIKGKILQTLIMDLPAARTNYCSIPLSTCESRLKQHLTLHAVIISRPRRFRTYFTLGTSAPSKKQMKRYSLYKTKRENESLRLKRESSKSLSLPIRPSTDHQKLSAPNLNRAIINSALKRPKCECLILKFSQTIIIIII